MKTDTVIRVWVSFCGACLVLTIVHFMLSRDAYGESHIKTERGFASAMDFECHLGLLFRIGGDAVLGSDSRPVECKLRRKLLWKKFY